MRRVGPLVAALVVLVVGAAVGATPAPAAAQAPTIDATYAAPGPAPSVATADVHDAGGRRTHRLYYPADLTGRHAVVAWGNGSFENPDKYEPLLHHLASWGFIVVAAETSEAGSGREILAGARYVIAADADPASPFFGHVDTTHVGAAGHSQGAGGSVRAASDPGTVITTVVPVALPMELFQLLGANKDFQTERLRVPALFMSGSEDGLISSAGTVARYYGRVPGPAAMGILEGADHNAVQIDGGGFRGYLTAWLRWQLSGDAAAAAAFVGPAPELSTNAAWRNQRFKGLTGPSGPVGATVVDLPASTTTTAAPVVALAAPTASTGRAGSSALPTTGAGVALLGPVALVTLALFLRSSRCVPRQFAGR